MKIKIISSYNPNLLNAAPKAKMDIEKILKTNYNIDSIMIPSMTDKNSLYSKTIRRIRKVVLSIRLSLSNNLIIIQAPFTGKVNYTKRIKNKITLIHDLEGLRNDDEKRSSIELIEMKNSKFVISHNKKMTQFLKEKGIEEEKIVDLELFDYLANGNINEKYKFNKNNLTLIYPGNLVKEKSPFIYQLDPKRMNFKINLYGIGINNDISEKLIYKGSFKPDDINNLEGDIGLIWDGNYDESDENKWYKNYTKYNNPHKLSCCLAMGIPVIVWEKAAIADLVKKYNVGYTIHNIYDINNLVFDDYDVKRANAIELGKKVRNGFFTQRVMNEILDKLDK